MFPGQDTWQQMVRISSRKMSASAEPTEATLLTQVAQGSPLPALCVHDQKIKAAGYLPASHEVVSHLYTDTYNSQNGGGGNRTRILISPTYNGEKTSGNDPVVGSNLAARQGRKLSRPVAN